MFLSRMVVRHSRKCRALGYFQDTRIRATAIQRLEPCTTPMHYGSRLTFLAFLSCLSRMNRDCSRCPARSPFDKFKLPDEHRLEPPAGRYFFRGRTCTPAPGMCLRQIRERAIGNLQGHSCQSFDHTGIDALEAPCRYGTERWTLPKDLKAIARKPSSFSSHSHCSLSAVSRSAVATSAR